MLTADEDHPIYERLTPETEQKLLQQGRSELLERYNQLRTVFIGAAKHDPLRSGFEPDMWKRADRQVEELKKLFPSGVTQLLNLGGNRACLVTGSEIWDPVEGLFRQVQRIRAEFHVVAATIEGFQAAEAEIPFSKGKLDCIEVSLSNGESFNCSMDHRVRATTGWITAGKLRKGQQLSVCPSGLYRPESIAALSPSVSHGDDQHSSGRGPDSRYGCYDDLHSHGGQPHTAPGIAQDVFPSQGGEHAHSTSSGSSLWPWQRDDDWLISMRDDLARKLQCIHHDLLSFLLASTDGQHLIAARSFGKIYDSFCKPCKSTSLSPAYREILEALMRLTHAYDLLLSNSESVPRDTQSDCELPFGTIAAQVTGVKPIGIQECWDFHVPEWQNYVHAGVVHHNSKTHRAAKSIMQLMISKPGARVWCLQSTETVSKADQQPLIFSMIPPEWRPISGRLKAQRRSLDQDRL